MPNASPLVMESSKCYTISKSLRDLLDEIRSANSIILSELIPTGFT